MSKYELTKEASTYLGNRVYRIRACKDIPTLRIRKGDLGGYVASEKNLSQEGLCWVGNDAVVYGNATVFGDALVYNRAVISGDAVVCGNARVEGFAEVRDKALVCGNAEVLGDSLIDHAAVVNGDAVLINDTVHNAYFQKEPLSFFDYCEVEKVRRGERR